MGIKSFNVTVQPVSPVEAKNFINSLYSDPDISLGPGASWVDPPGDPFGEFVYNFLDNSGYDADSALEGSMEELDIDDSGEVTGRYYINFDDESDMNIKFKGFVAQGDGYKFILIKEVNW